MKTLSPNGLNNIPVDSRVLTYGFGAEPVCATITAPQSNEGTYEALSDAGATHKISPDDIVSVYTASLRDRTLNHSLQLLGYTTEPLPHHEKRILFNGREVFRGRAGDVWEWLQRNAFRHAAIQQPA